MKSRFVAAVLMIFSAARYHGVAEEIIVTINTSNEAQEVVGFGASLTDSSAWLLHNQLPGAVASNILKTLFSPTEGIGLNVLRQPIGASDFRMMDYTFDDMPPGQTDYALTNFSIAHDTNYILPLLRQISLIQTNLKIIATPWSPPAWMKTSEHLYYGSLKTNAFSALAAYLRKFVQAYTTAGVPIYALTLQNEPHYQSYTYPSMTMTATQQAQLVKDVAADFATNSLSTRVLIYDHNWDQFSYSLSVLSDTAAAPLIAGIAFHGYAGDPSAQTIVHDMYPDKDIYFTESSGGSWSGSFTNSLMWDAENLIIGALRNWAVTVIKWNLVLDQNGGPKLGGGCETCRGLLTVNTNTLLITTNSEFYTLAHVSKFLKPGAKRVATIEENGAPPRSVAFVNPDQTRVLVAYNPATSTNLYTVRVGDESFVYALPPKSLATFVWSNVPAAGVEVWLTTADQANLLTKQTNGPAFASRRFVWKGRAWIAADSVEPVIGTPFSPACVSVDSNGYLHVATKPLGGTWFSGRVVSDDSPSFGTYRWYIVGRPDLLHTNLVADWGLYANSYHALQTEFAPAYDDDPTNLFFTVAPYYLENHRYSAAHSLTGFATTWEIHWTPRRAEFRAWYGYSGSPATTSAVIAQWSYEGSDVPGDTNEVIRMGLAMFEGLRPSASQELIFADFMYTPAAGVLFFDDFEDGTLSSIWQTVANDNGAVVESNGLLQLTPADSDGGMIGVRTVSAFECADDGFTRTFSFRLAGLDVSRECSTTGVDVWVYQAIMSGSNDLFTPRTASNSVTLRVGLDASANQLTVELLTKTNQSGTLGTPLFVGTIANATNFFDTTGLDFVWSLTYSNYELHVVRGGNPVAVTIISGQSTGRIALADVYGASYCMLGAENEADARGAAEIGQVEGILSTVLGSTAGGEAGDGTESRIVQIGKANPSATWRAPIDSTYTRHRATIVYRADDLARSGLITQLWIYVLSAPNITLSNFTIRMQHTISNEMSSSFNNAGWTTVHQQSVSFPANFSGWFPLPFSTPFAYDARSNLMVDFVFSNTLKAGVPVPAATWTATNYVAALVVSSDRNDPFAWTAPPGGKKYSYWGSRVVDVRFAFSTTPPIPLGSNLSFESGPSGFLTNVPAWTVVGSPYAGIVKAGLALHGNQSLKLWRDAALGGQTLYQDFVPTPTNDYVLSGFLLSESGEPLEGVNAYATFRLEWFGTNGLLQTRDAPHFTAGYDCDVWHSFAVTASPPAGAVSGRFSCVLAGEDDQRGSVHFDRIDIRAVERTSPPGGNTPTPSTVFLEDQFNDTTMSNVWQYTGHWDGADFQESNGLLRVRPGTNAWQSSGYVTSQPIEWNNTSIWYVFSATLATVRVDAASNTNDIEILLGMCSEPDNPWWVTNSCGLYGYYDATSDRLIAQLLLKTDRPAQSGTERFNATFTNISSVLNGTNRMVISIALGKNQYDVQFNDLAGRPVPYHLNSGAPRGWHYLGDKLNRAHWLVGAQADGTKRGDVFWDTTQVYCTDEPSLNALTPTQRSDGSGRVEIPCVVADANGDRVRLFVQARTQDGSDWTPIRISSVTAMHACAEVVPNGSVPFVAACSTNTDGYLVSNQVVVLWDTHADGLDGQTWSNVSLRIYCDDGAVSASAVTSAAFMVDNEPPSPNGVILIVESNAPWTFNRTLHVAWTPFADTGSGVAGHYAAFSDGTGTTQGIWSTAMTCSLTGAVPDAVNAVFVWAQDARGNLGSAISTSIVVLSEQGDFDADDLSNMSELMYGCDPTSRDTDTDIMSDGWEIEHGFSPTNADDAQADTDSDGYNNRAEFLCGTDPLNPNSSLAFEGLLGPSQSWVMQWSGATGRVYTIYSTTDPSKAWEVEPDASQRPGIQGNMMWTARSENARGFYRLRVEKTR